MFRSRHHLHAPPLRAMTPNRPVQDARLESNSPALLPTRYSLPAPSKGPVLSKRSASNGFTIVEVMMASVILVVGFIGMISAITVGSEMLATARRQTLAAQLISHELEELRMVAWSTTTTVGGTTFTNGISGMTAGTSTLTIDSQFSAAVTACGLTTNPADLTNPYITVERTVADVVSGSLREVTITVTWRKSGTTAAANLASGSWLTKLSLSGNAPIRRTYVRSGSTYFGKYGLNNSYQRS